jgi:hypothetical protein
MNGPGPFDARVTASPPPRRHVVAPERDVVTGRYRDVTQREDKHRRSERDDAGRPRRPSRPRPRRPRVWQVAVGGAAAAVAVGTAVVIAAGDDEAPSATPTTVTTAVTEAGAPTTDAGTVAATTPRETVGAVAPTAAVVTAPTVAPSTAATVASTTTVVLVPNDIATGLTGEYTFAMTITDGNDNFPVGTSQEVPVSFVADCAAPGCTVTSPQYPGVSWSFDGTTFAASLTVPEPCPNAPDITLQTVVDVSLQTTARDPDGLPSTLSGTQTQSTPDATGCPQTVNDPITYAITATRV